MLNSFQHLRNVGLAIDLSQNGGLDTIQTPVLQSPSLCGKLY
jgi:hypothetical protein